MRRALGAAAAGVAALLLLAGTADAALEPVSITATAPPTVTAGEPFKLEVSVEADAGALDLAAQPLLLGVKLAPECGGSFVGTPGAPVLEGALTVPAGAAVKQAFAPEVTAPAAGTEVICAFLQDSQERQFATDTEAEVTVLSAGAAAAAAARRVQQCTTATKQMTIARRSLKRLDRRIARARRQKHRAQGAHRRALTRKLHMLRAKRRNLARQRARSAKTTAGTCS